MCKVKKNIQGSAIIQAMIAVALMSIVGLGVASLSTNMTNAEKINDLNAQANTSVRLFGAIGSNNELCRTSIDALPNFKPADAQKDINAAGGAQKLRICIPSFTADGTCDPGPADWFPQNAGTPKDIPGTRLRVREIVFSNAGPPQAIGPLTQYKGRLSVFLETTVNPAKAFAAREALSEMTILVNGANQIVGCSAASSAEQICKSMGCIYNEAAIAPELPCTCGFPDMACAAGEIMVGVNAGGAPICVPGTDTCPAGQVVKHLEYNNGGINLTCAPVGAWDYSDFNCVGGVATRTVRCVNALAMDRYMRTNGFTTFQAALPANIQIDENFCDPAEKPEAVGACSIPCIVAAGSTWMSGLEVCVADSDVYIPDAGTGTATDIIGPAVGSASYSCSAGILTQTGGNCSTSAVLPVCGADNGASLAATPVNLCSAGVPSPVVGTGPWSWTCSGIGSVACSATSSAATPVAAMWVPKLTPCSGTYPLDGQMRSNGTGQGGSIGSDVKKIRSHLCVNFQVQWSVTAPDSTWIDSGLRDDSDPEHDFSEDSNNNPLQAWWIKGPSIGTARWHKTYSAGCPAGWVDLKIWDDDYERRDLNEGGATPRIDNLCIYPMPAACDGVMLCPGGTYKVRGPAAGMCGNVAAMDTFCNDRARGGVNDYNFFGLKDDHARKSMTYYPYFGSCFSGAAKAAVAPACTTNPLVGSFFTCECL